MHIGPRPRYKRYLFMVIIFSMVFIRNTYHSIPSILFVLSTYNDHHTPHMNDCTVDFKRMHSSSRSATSFMNAWCVSLSTVFTFRLVWSRIGPYFFFFSFCLFTCVVPVPWTLVSMPFL